MPVPDHLYCPLSRQALHYDPQQHCLLTPDGSYQYPIVDGIPRLLVPDHQAAAVQQPELHKRSGSEFHYREHYQHDAEVFDYFQPPDDAATRHEARRLHEMIATQVPADTVRLLDVGCGNAWVAGRFLPRGMEVYSLDITSVNPAKAWERYPDPRHMPLVADVYALPFKEGFFDTIIASEIIEHVPDPASFIDKLLSVLRVGGKLIVTTPYREKITYSLCVHCNRPTPQHAHLHSFDRDSMRSLFKEEQKGRLWLVTFSSKVLNKLQTHRLLQYLPWRIWRSIDRLVNQLIDKPGRLMSTFVKTEN